MAFKENNSFTKAARIASILGKPLYDENTNPTLQGVIDLMATAAGQIEAKLAAAGYARTAPGGANPIDGTDAQSNSLRNCLDMANAYYVCGAVAQTYQAERPDEFDEKAEDCMNDAMVLVRKLVGSTAAVHDKPESVPGQFANMEMKF